MDIIYFKDRFIPKSEARLSIDDRSFRFGDGVFETIFVHRNIMHGAAQHFQRLQNGLDAFRIPFNAHSLEAICQELVQRNNLSTGYVRIIISRGENDANAIGYKPNTSSPYAIIQTMEKPTPSFQSLRLCVSEQRASMHLPGKINSAMLYVMAMIEAEEQQCDNAIICDTNSHVCETASGNLFWLKDGVLHTPSTDLPFVPGTIRQTIIESSPYTVKQGHYTLDDLRAADEIMMTNIGLFVASIESIATIGFRAQSQQVANALYQHIVQTITS